jgi:uncharacterized tellurite resistance protein B-like protein
MLDGLKALLDSWLPPAPGLEAADEQRALQLATAVMLVEVMRADGRFNADEQAAVRRALKDRFGLGDAQAQQLETQAEASASRATDYFSFTSRLNAHFDMAQKVRLVEEMWRVAYADGHLSEVERHVLWRVADLLHVPQGAYVNARLRAETEASTRADADMPPAPFAAKGF